MITDSGRQLWLSRMRQERTYLSVIQGLPNPGWNKQKIVHVMAEAEEWSRMPVHLIDPVIIDYTEELGEKIRRIQDPHQRQNLKRLPLVVCMAELESDKIKRLGCCWSALTVVWFQDDPAFPMDPSVGAILKSLNWETLAIAWEF